MYFQSKVVLVFWGASRLKFRKMSERQQMWVCLCILEFAVSCLDSTRCARTVLIAEDQRPQVLFHVARAMANGIHTPPDSERSLVIQNFLTFERASELALLWPSTVKLWVEEARIWIVGSFPMSEVSRKRHWLNFYEESGLYHVMPTLRFEIRVDREDMTVERSRDRGFFTAPKYQSIREIIKQRVTN